ncbi:MAG: hypothetical protein AAGH87_05760 [Pseudomonadota bacterium]
MPPSARLRPVLAAALVFSLGACASLEPEPCTPAWVDAQTEAVLVPFAREYRSEIAVLRDLSGNLDNPGPLTALRMVGQAETLAAMFEDFQDRALPRLEAALDECDAPGEAAGLLVAMLEREGVEGDVLAWIETLGVLVAAVNAERASASGEPAAP